VCDSTRGATSVDRPTTIPQSSDTNIINLVQQNRAAEEFKSEDATDTTKTIQSENDWSTAKIRWLNEAPNEYWFRHLVMEKVGIWLNEAPDERWVRFKVMKEIGIVNNDQLVVTGDLDLRNTKISSLPEDFHVRGYLDLRGCTRITSLNKVHVKRDLDLSGCPSLETLHQVRVGGNVYLKDCTA
jgi:hypothetical protein